MGKIPEYRSLNLRAIYGSKNSAIHEDIQTTVHSGTEKSRNTLRSRQETHPERREEDDAYFNHICEFDN